MARVQVNNTQAKKDWDVYFKNFLAEVSADLNETEAQRKKRIAWLESDFEEWKKYYFPKYCYAPAAKFHIKASKRILSNPEWYESRVWARELAKDVVCMIETLYQTLTGIKKNILFISNSNEKACDLLEPYRINLEKNERIINDYGIQQMPGSWASGDFITTQGVSFLAIGAGQSPRGSRNEEVRPDKVIVSDIDTDEDVLNPDTIEKRWNWFEKAVYGTRSVSKDFQVIFLGNLIAKDCCIARSMEKADKVDIVNIEDEDGNSTWEEKNSKENIDRIRGKISTSAFEGEYMNNPLQKGTVFAEMNWGKVPHLRRFKFLINYGDPSPSNNKGKAKSKSAHKAFALVGYLDGIFYVITCRTNKATNAEFIDWLYDINRLVPEGVQVYNYIENNKLQDPHYQQVILKLYAEKAKKEGFINITADERGKPDKYNRIEGNLEPLNNQLRLVLNIDEKNNPHMERLEDQFLLLTPQLSAPADGADAVEGAVWIINEKIKSAGVDDMKLGKRPKNKKRV